MSDLEQVLVPVCEEKMRYLEDRVDRLEAITDEIHKLTLSVERLTITVQNMVAEQESQKKRLNIIEAADGEKWRILIRYAATAFIGAVIGYIAKNVGLG